MPSKLICGGFSSADVSTMMPQLVLMMLVGADLCVSSVSAEASCPPPPPRKNAKHFNETLNYPRGCDVSYACKKGFRRKAGTQALYTCVEDNGVLKWEVKDMVFECIEDPAAKEKDLEYCAEATVSTTAPSTPASTVHLQRGGTGSSSITKHHVVLCQMGVGIVCLVGVPLLVILTIGVLVKIKMKRKQWNMPTPQEEGEPMSPENKS